MPVVRMASELKRPRWSHDEDRLHVVPREESAQIFGEIPAGKDLLLGGRVYQGDVEESLHRPRFKFRRVGRAAHTSRGREVTVAAH